MESGKVKDLLLNTSRKGMKNLVDYMEENGFFTAPCSTSHHLAKEGGLAEHSLNVCDIAISLIAAFDADSRLLESVIICSLLHDIGKMGQFGKPNYVPNMLKGRATKANPNPEPYQSDKKPYTTNPELLLVDHEVRALSIISRYIDLTEEEQQAILWHNGLYGPFKYEIQGKETPLYMILHFADMWASRIVEAEDGDMDD
ncbi:HD family phosphohydrolase [Extibacter muris]|uniref:HD family phosphohydrolase n=1 Tax=Extibacter muris TaxID=1796622 RepID=A0A4R4FEB1_9FIRM|nr:HD family phosphohydrolase [Extibacter muris]MCU0079307.1 HD family phosphohydrolase [Extibacter muris]TDA21964.1 HD family phosphohydrolase [Extibacter muris]